jgi:hypothetical protein
MVSSFPSSLTAVVAGAFVVACSSGGSATWSTDSGVTMGGGSSSGGGSSGTSGGYGDSGPADAGSESTSAAESDGAVAGGDALGESDASVVLPGGGNYVGSSTPDFGPNVLIFDPSMGDSTIQTTLDGIFNAQETNQFGANRYAYFFKPGSYTLDVQLGFYMQALGLGAAPDDVSITGAVRSMATWNDGNATDNFWRSAENLAITPSTSITTLGDVWAISQGTALRRVHVENGGLVLFDYTENGPNNWSSGGFIADTQVDGTVVSGSQQQFITRNVTMQAWNGGVWNMVFVGNSGDPTGSWPTSPYTFVATTPTVREKPYLTIDASGNYSVVAPTLALGTLGTAWGGGATPPSTTTPIDKFYIAQASTDTAATINAALGKGANLILTPGVYALDSALHVTRPGTIVLGLGLATLVPTQGNSSITVDDVDGVTIGGIIFDAGPVQSPTLLELGTTHAAVLHDLSPTALFDVYCRVGGATAGTTRSCVTVNSNDVEIDNVWLWRADHGSGVGWNANVAANGIIVNGDHVTAYGLFVEHFEQFQTLWNGNAGTVYFYQSEIPYDVPSQAVWTQNGENGYPSLKVTSSVTDFDARGLGIYCYFDNDVVLDNAVEAPMVPGVTFQHIVTQWFTNAPGSAIDHIIDGTGNAVNASNTGATTPD